MKHLIEAARSPAEIREYMYSGGRLNILRQSNLVLPCVGSGLKCWVLFCDLDMIPHFPPPRLVVTKWSSSLSIGRIRRTFLEHLVGGRQLIGRDATSWFTDRVKAAA